MDSLESDLASIKADFAAIRRDIRTINWMLLVQIALTPGILVKLFMP